MTSIRKTFSVLAVFALVGGFAARAEALPIVTVVPGDQTVGVGATFDVDIVVDTQGESLGGFSFFLNFDDTILQALGYTNDPSNQFGGLFDLSLPVGLGTSPLDIFAFGGPSATGVFVLTNVEFKAIAPGFSVLDLANVVLSSANGDQFTIPNAADGRVCVGTAPCPVPEPGLLALLTTGLATAFVRRRARRS